jgi:DNA-binding NarL/FixJ family response regulator
VVHTRIVLIGISPLLHEIVRDALSEAPDLDLVAEHEAAVDVGEAVARDRPDFVILGSQGDVEESVRSLVAANRGVRALEIRSDGRESVLYELRPHRVSLGEISTDKLVGTIRAAASWEEEL